MSCRELGLYAEAKASLLRALELKPNYVEAHVSLGVLHQKLGNLTDAVKTWERALQLDPKHRLARMYLKQATASGTTARGSRRPYPRLPSCPGRGRSWPAGACARERRADSTSW